MVKTNRKMKTNTYTGYICLHDDGEASDILFLSDVSEPLAEAISDEITNREVSVRYWVSDVEKSKQELKEDTIKHLVGALEAEYYHRYSDYTGYLWTEEHLNIGGHNLLSEIRSYKGKYLHLEIDIHENT